MMRAKTPATPNRMSAEQNHEEKNSFVVSVSDMLQNKDINSNMVYVQKSIQRFYKSHNRKKFTAPAKTET